MNVPAIDIHRHIIASDTETYPRAPRGGHRSPREAPGLLPDTHRDRIFSRAAQALCPALADRR